MSRQEFSFPRQLLLIEIERRCQTTGCGAKNLIGLTKPEAIGYRGFECGECKGWNEDRLRSAEVPDWWEDIEGNETFH